MKAPVIAGCKLWIGNKRKRQAKKKVKWFTSYIKMLQKYEYFASWTYVPYLSKNLQFMYADYRKGYLAYVLFVDGEGNLHHLNSLFPVTTENLTVFCKEYKVYPTTDTLETLALIKEKVNQMMEQWRKE